MNNKFIGGLFIILGSCIGGGILGLPITGLKLGVGVSLLLLAATGFLTLLCSLYILEVTLHFPLNENHYGTMTKNLLGQWGKISTGIVYLLYMLFMNAAYMSGGASALERTIINPMIGFFPHWAATLLFVVPLTSVVFFGAKTVDYVIRFFFSIKGVFLFLAFVFLLSFVQGKGLITLPQANTSFLEPSLVFLNAFAFAYIIPSVVNYVGFKPRQLKKIIILGTLLPFFLYSLWIIATVGVLIPFKNQYPLQGVGEIGQALINVTQSKWVVLGIRGFLNITITTGFLGLNLGLFDFITDLFKIPNKTIGKVQTACIALLPALFYTILFPNGFIWAYSFATYFLIYLFGILPIIMVYKLRNVMDITTERH